MNQKRSCNCGATHVATCTALVGAPLTATEQLVFNQFAQGKPLKVVAENLALSVNTVKTHTQRIFRKKGVNSQVELVLAAFKERGMSL